MSGSLSHGQPHSTPFATVSPDSAIQQKLRKKKVTQKRESKKTILENSLVMKRLEEAFTNGATLAQAARHARCSLTALKRHKRENTLLTYEGEEMEFDDLLEMWRSEPAYIAKKKVLDEIRKEDSGTGDAKWLLERMERETYGAVLPPLSLEKPQEDIFDLSADARATIARWTDHERPERRIKALPSSMKLQGASL